MSKRERLNPIPSTWEEINRNTVRTNWKNVAFEIRRRAPKECSDMVNQIIATAVAEGIPTTKEATNQTRSDVRRIKQDLGIIRPRRAVGRPPCYPNEQAKKEARLARQRARLCGTPMPEPYPCINKPKKTKLKGKLPSGRPKPTIIAEPKPSKPSKSVSLASPVSFPKKKKTSKAVLDPEALTMLFTEPPSRRRVRLEPEVKFPKSFKLEKDVIERTMQSQNVPPPLPPFDVSMRLAVVPPYELPPKPNEVPGYQLKGKGGSLYSETMALISSLGKKYQQINFPTTAQLNQAFRKLHSLEYLLYDKYNVSIKRRPLPNEKKYLDGINLKTMAEQDIYLPHTKRVYISPNK
jgi:hypothetical protein